MAKSEQDNFYKRLGEYIRARRVTRGMTRLDFAKSLQMTPQQMSRVESGSRRVDVWTFGRIAEGLKIKLSTLFYKGKGDI